MCVCVKIHGIPVVLICLWLGIIIHLPPKNPPKKRPKKRPHGGAWSPEKKNWCCSKHLGLPIGWKPPQKFRPFCSPFFVFSWKTDVVGRWVLLLPKGWPISLIFWGANILNFQIGKLDFADFKYWSNKTQEITPWSRMQFFEVVPKRKKGDYHKWVISWNWW